MCQRSISQTVSKSKSKHGYTMSSRMCQSSIRFTVSKAIRLQDVELQSVPEVHQSYSKQF